MELKTESDGRMFPVTNDSATIVACLLKAAAEAGVRVVTGVGVRSLSKDTAGFEIELTTGETVEADRVLIGFGEGTVTKILACLKGDAPGLDQSPRFQAAWKRVAPTRVATVGWFDLKGAIETATRAAGPAGVLFQPMLRGFGADALESLVTGTGVENGNVVQRTFLATGGRTDGLLLLAGGPTIRSEQLKHIPADCDLVAAGSLNLAQTCAAHVNWWAEQRPHRPRCSTKRSSSWSQNSD